MDMAFGRADCLLRSRLDPKRSLAVCEPGSLISGRTDSRDPKST